MGFRHYDYEQINRLSEQGMRNCDIADMLDCDEGTIRYALKQGGRKVIRKKAMPSRADNTLAITNPQEAVKQDIQISETKDVIEGLGKKYKAALDQIKFYEQKLDVYDYMSKNPPKDYVITPKSINSSAEATAVTAASDWHVDEIVDARSVDGGLNEYNPDIAKKRAEVYFKSVLRLTDIHRNATKIDNLILFLGGDFITSWLHEGDEEKNAFNPQEATIYAQNLLYSGISFIRKYGKFKNIKVICKVGNHARTTKKIRFATEYKNSYEWMMYNALAMAFEKDKVLDFIIPQSYLYTMDVYGYKLRFHHGHAIRYRTGVGGIAVPAKGAIAKWNVTNPVYYDIFGHLHTYTDGGNFLCNGSLIGYTAYSEGNHFEGEDPRQAYFLMDPKRGKTATWPIFVDR